jgi:F0F1-type ATP synthase assembly protein I
MARKIKGKDLKAFSLLGYLGFVIVINIGVGLGIGLLIDKYINTSPWFTLFFLFFGILNAFRSMFRLVNEVNR